MILFICVVGEGCCCRDGSHVYAHSMKPLSIILHFSSIGWSISIQKVWLSSVGYKALSIQFSCPFTPNKKYIKPKSVKAFLLKKLIPHVLLWRTNSHHCKFQTLCANHCFAQTVIECRITSNCAPLCLMEISHELLHSQ